MRLKVRYVAALIHLLASVLIASIILLLAYFVWFPGDLIMAGGIAGITILIGVDITLGPVLTLVVFDTAKKSLKLDLLIIVLLQLACLAVGVWLIYHERPVAQLLADDGIHLPAKSDADHYQADIKLSFFAKPPLKIIELPELPAEVAQVKMTSEFVQGKPFIFRTDLYIEPSADVFAKRVEYIYQNLGPTHKADIDKLPEKQCSWMPLHAKHKSGYACVSASEGIVHIH